MFNSLTDFESWFDVGDMEAEDSGDASAASQREQVGSPSHCHGARRRARLRNLVESLEYTAALPR